MGCDDIHDEMNEEARKVMNVVKCYDCRNILHCERVKIEVPSDSSTPTTKVVDLCPRCFMRRTKDGADQAKESGGQQEVAMSRACMKGSGFNPSLTCAKVEHHSGMCEWMKCSKCQGVWIGARPDSQGRPLCSLCQPQTPSQGPSTIKTHKSHSYQLFYAHCKWCMDLDHMLTDNQDPRDGFCRCGCHRRPIVTESNKPDMIDPDHYGGKDSSSEHVKIALEKGWDKRAFLYNGTKYLWRLGDKPGAAEAEDLEKAIWFLMRELEKVKGLSLRALEMKEKK